MNKKIDAFNTVAGFYDDWYKHPQGKQVFQAEKNAVESLIPEKGLGIEIGAGTGIFTKALTTVNRSILCLDPSIEMMKKARNRDLPCILGVGDSLPIRCNSLDFSYLITVLEFLDEPYDLFKETKKISKHDATLTILFINSGSSWGELYRNIGEKGDPVFRHANLFSLDQVSALLKKTDYSIMDTIGTLNSDPDNQDVDDALVEPSVKSGVIIVKAI